jgi:hypothetical protein
MFSCSRDFILQVRARAAVHEVACERRFVGRQLSVVLGPNLTSLAHRLVDGFGRERTPKLCISASAERSVRTLNRSQIRETISSGLIAC